MMRLKKALFVFPMIPPFRESPVKNTSQLDASTPSKESDVVDTETELMERKGKERREGRSAIEMLK